MATIKKPRKASECIICAPRSTRCSTRGSGCFLSLTSDVLADLKCFFVDKVSAGQGSLRFSWSHIEVVLRSWCTVSCMTAGFLSHRMFNLIRIRVTTCPLIPFCSSDGNVMLSHNKVFLFYLYFVLLSFNKVKALEIREWLRHGRRTNSHWSSSHSRFEQFPVLYSKIYV